MTKLYKVKLKFEYVVVAENGGDAQEKAKEYAGDAFNDTSIRCMTLDVSEGSDAFNWDDRCIPYGGDGNKTIAEYRKEHFGVEE